MHRGVRDQLEEILASTGDALCERHLSECEECSSEVEAMREQRALLRSLRTQDTPEQSAGFYARVMERIEAQNVVSIWELFFNSRVGKGLAMASMAVALCLSAYLVSEEQNRAPDDGQVMVERTHGLRGALADGMLAGTPDANAVLANLVTYREQ